MGGWGVKSITRTASAVKNERWIERQRDRKRDEETTFVFLENKLPGTYFREQIFENKFSIPDSDKDREKLSIDISPTYSATIHITKQSECPYICFGPILLTVVLGVAKKSRGSSIFVFYNFYSIFITKFFKTYPLPLRTMRICIYMVWSKLGTTVNDSSNDPSIFVGRYLIFFLNIQKYYVLKLIALIFFNICNIFKFERDLKGNQFYRNIERMLLQSNSV